MSKLQTTQNQTSLSSAKLDDSLDIYNEKEIEYLDKYKELSENTIDDDELYNIIIKYNFDDFMIKKEVLEHRNLVKKRGEEYGWTKIERGKSK